ncbi:MAG: hypothetical protein GIW95_00895 [Candidatus Eremiobacteraeota bacterium]|nr:hypothetical protein [Candidatus Eremiobacteraeota bacterium]
MNDAPLRRLALLGACAVGVHSLLLLAVVLPPNPVRTFVEPRANYLAAFFYQAWDLFAPPGTVSPHAIATVNGRRVDLMNAFAARERGRFEPSLSRQLLWQASDAVGNDAGWTSTPQRKISADVLATFQRAAIGVERGLFPGARFGREIVLELHPIGSNSGVERIRITAVPRDDIPACCSTASR